MKSNRFSNYLRYEFGPFIKKPNAIDFKMTSKMKIDVALMSIMFKTDL